MHEGSGFVVAKTHAMLEGKPICGAELTFRVLPWPEGRMKPVVMKVAELVSFPLKDFVDA